MCYQCNSHSFFNRKQNTFDNVINILVSNHLLCIFLFKKEKKENMNEKNKHVEKSSKLGGVAWMQGRRSPHKKYNIQIPIKLTENPIFLLLLLYIFGHCVLDRLKVGLVLTGRSTVLSFDLTWFSCLSFDRLRVFGLHGIYFIC